MSLGGAESNSKIFTHLSILNMNNTNITDWDELDSLTTLTLDEIRLIGIPLLEVRSWGILLIADFSQPAIAMVTWDGTIEMNIWIGNHQSQGQADWFACDVTIRTELPRNHYDYISLFFFKRVNNSTLAFIQLTELFTVSMKLTVSPITLFHFDGVRTSSDCSRCQPYTADWLSIHMFITMCGTEVVPCCFPKVPRGGKST